MKLDILLPQCGHADLVKLALAKLKTQELLEAMEVELRALVAELPD